MTEHTTLICPKCYKQCECVYIAGFSQTNREAGSTGISHFVTKRKADKILGDCKCGYKFKTKDLEEC